MSTLETIGKYRRHLYVICALFLLSIGAVVYLSGDAIQLKKINLYDLLPVSYQETEIQKLDRVLKNASMDDGTVILVTLNEAWAKPDSIFDIFLESFRIGEQTQALMKHIVIVAIDEKAMDRCKEMDLHCYLFTIGGLKSAGTEKRFMSNDYVTLIWERLHFFGKVLELGYSFLLTDVDILWFRTPFDHLLPSDDITVACDRYTNNPYDPANKANVGFIHVKSNNRTIDFYNYWYQMNTKYPRATLTQYVFDNIKTDEHTKDLGLKIKYLDTAIFGCFCEHGSDLNKLCTLHANCCIGLDLKIHDMKIILNVWKKFSNLTEDLKLQGLPWKAPINCKM